MQINKFKATVKPSDVSVSFFSVKESVLNAVKVLRPYWKSLSYQDDLTEGEEPEVTALLDWPPRLV